MDTSIATPSTSDAVRRETAATRNFGPHTKISVLIPCFNEQDVLPILHHRLDSAAQTWGADYEIILIDDGSTDRTRDMIADIHAADPRWKMVGLARNFGHQIALWTGLTVAGGDVVAVLDADLQDPPEVLPRFFDKWKEGYDVIYGVRHKRKEGLLKRAAYSTFYRLLSRLSEVSIPLDTGDFCVMDRRVVELLASVPDRRPFIRGLRAWSGFRQFGLVYERHARAAGEAKYTLYKLFKLAFDGIFSSSIRPLRAASYMGAIISALSFLGVIFTLLQRIFAEQFAQFGLRPVPGFATIVITILFLGGVQLLTIGLLGEYIGRIYENVKGRPVSVISTTLGLPPPATPSSAPNLPTSPRKEIRS
jgi:polyisoprenyl-phosphate glycosyltransferase